MYIYIRIHTYIYIHTKYVHINGYLFIYIYVYIYVYDHTWSVAGLARFKALRSMRIEPSRQVSTEEAIPSPYAPLQI